MQSIKRCLGSSLETDQHLLFYYLPFYYLVLLLFMQPAFVKFQFLWLCGSVYSSEEDEEETEMYEHDYDGSLAKAGKRHLGKTRWTREEVHTRPVSQLKKHL